MTLEGAIQLISLIIYSLFGFIIYSKTNYGGGASKRNFTRAYIRNETYFEWERWIGLLIWQAPIIVIGIIYLVMKWS